MCAAVVDTELAAAALNECGLIRDSAIKSPQKQQQPLRDAAAASPGKTMPKASNKGIGKSPTKKPFISPRTVAAADGAGEEVSACGCLAPCSNSFIFQKSYCF
jgi:hypothetical protein